MSAYIYSATVENVGDKDLEDLENPLDAWYTKAVVVAML